VKRLTLVFAAATLTVPGTLFGKPIRISTICIAGVAAACVLKVKDGAGVTSFSTETTGTGTDQVFANVSDLAGRIAQIPPDLVLTPQDTLTLTFAATPANPVVVSYEEI